MGPIVGDALALSSEECQGDLVGEEHPPLGENEVAVPALQQPRLEVGLRLHEIDRVDRDTVTSPKPERHSFEAKLLGVQKLVPCGRGQAPAHGLVVLQRRADVPPSPSVAMRMGRAPDAEADP